ncbi:uncharacterized protein LOC110848234 [Folsomia candida]|uniref:uncharacterized protein LOC110848234 n=1 Tax=Folsomia candida TaxID=158441 RepID=UPI000B907133|nr:uncharacterized protein LOC110848234 [Folsomia candida]
MDKPPKAPVRKRLFLQRPHPRHPNSTNNAYILVLGPPNCGKSTTINCLFNHREIASVSPVEGTNSIHEFSTNFHSQRNLKLIDTPGVGNPLNAVWDTKVIATLKKYMDTDRELSHCIPNVVLIVGRFDDERLTDANGPFVKSLQAINLLNSRLFDKFSCNVVILLTHFMQGDEAYRASSHFRRDEVMDLIKNYTQFPQMPYIIFGENSIVRKTGGRNMFIRHPEYGGKCFNLSEHDDSSAEDIYPSNLIDLIIKISAGSTQGALGPEYFRSIFQNRERLFLWGSCSLPLVSSERKRFQKAFYALQQSYKTEESKEKERETAFDNSNNSNNNNNNNEEILKI